MTVPANPLLAGWRELSVLETATLMASTCLGVETGTGRRPIAT